MATSRQPLSYYLNLSHPFTVMPDNSTFFIEFPDLPGCMTQVEDRAQIPDAAEEVRTLWIEGEYDDGAMIPEPATRSEYSGKFVTRIPKAPHKSLVIAAREQNMSLNAYVGYLLANRTIGADLRARIDRLEEMMLEVLAEPPPRRVGATRGSRLSG